MTNVKDDNLERLKKTIDKNGVPMVVVESTLQTCVSCNKPMGALVADNHEDGVKLSEFLSALGIYSICQDCGLFMKKWRYQENDGL